MFSRLRPLRGVAGVCGGAVLGYLAADRTHTASSSWTSNTQPSVLWDWNWDRREPGSLVKPSRHKRMLEPDLNNNNSNGVIATTTTNTTTRSYSNIATTKDDVTNGSYPKGGRSNETDDEKLQKVRSKATRYLILVRHGQYNLEGETDGERILTELGREQARLTGERLKDLELPITRLVYSTMTRATETATIMMKHMHPIEKVETCELIREGAPIPPEPPVGHWRPETHFFSDGARIEAGFRRHFHRAPPAQEKDSYEVIVCHANVIRYAVCRALQFPPEAWLRLGLHHGSLTLLAIRPDGRVSMRQLGECGHMPPKLLSLS